YATVPADKVIMIRKGDIPASRRLEIDWRRIGEFDPYNDAGYYTCFVNNTETNGSRTIKIPADKVPVL
uniref:Uncharacterized protein n=1 Tax=Trichobilharzia regenti TaxID=157069 RepID=A0AA85K5G4_TRIRE